MESVLNQLEILPIMPIMYIDIKWSFKTVSHIKCKYVSIKQEKGTIKHKESGKCLDIAGVKSGGTVVVNPCNGQDSQIWTFEHYLNLWLDMVHLVVGICLSFQGFYTVKV